MKSEIRCSEKHTRMMEHAKPVWAEVLGVEIVTDESVPEGKIQFWRDGEMLEEIEVEI